MDARAVIEKVRHGAPLSRGEARWFGHALSGTGVSDAQAGAFAMAVCLRGLDVKARVALTEGMRDSGDVLAWDLPGPVLDKHSTGGVGDPVSLLLAPALACCGAYVPMISGRGLGHTGGTLDKLEAIPGYISEIGPKRLEHVLRDVGCAIVGATGRIAPSDKRLYAIRDVTATVESLDLITASILAKKLAAGLDGLVLDVKTGSGAFMVEQGDARALSQSLVDVAKGAGCATSALITDMSQPLADAAGNALEIRAVMETLTGANINTRLRDVVVALGAAVLVQGGVVKSDVIGAKKIEKALSSGDAAEKFSQMVAAMGGPEDFATSWKHCLPEATIAVEVPAGNAGFVGAIDTRALGEAVVALGGGRLRASDRIDHAVGLSGLAPLGAKLDAKTPLAMVHASDPKKAERAIAAVSSAYRITKSAPPETALILEVVT
jgi:thymidine phosphorylase